LLCACQLGLGLGNGGLVHLDLAKKRKWLHEG
jgi:hypothetical protein